MTLGLTDVTVGAMDVTIVITALAVTAGSATDVAVTTIEFGDGAVLGAVYTPVVALIVPSEPAAVTVGSDHVTFRQVGLLRMTHPGLFTVAVKLLNVSPVPIVAPPGVMEMLMPVIIVIEADWVLLVSAAEVAVTFAVGVTTGGPPFVPGTVGSTLGAV
jgi:hypothetical protein